MSKNFDVICIGAALVDMVATVFRYPEDDDEVFVSDLSIQSGGAAANTAAACSTLGLETAFIGKLGHNDHFGTKILRDFKDVSVSTEYIKYSREHSTGSAYVALNQKTKNRRIFAHSGAANYLSKEDIVEKEIISSKLIYLSSLKNIYPFIKAAQIAQANDIPVLLNPGMLIIEQGFENIKGLLRRLNILILSRREFITLLELPSNNFSEESFTNAAKKLREIGIEVIIITLGKDGALIISKDESFIVPSYDVEKVKDTTGAGDAFSAGFMYGYIMLNDKTAQTLAKCAKIGNFIAGKCIQKLGALNGIPSKIQIDSLVRL